MQAIETHYVGATGSRCARAKARAQDGHITIPWNTALNRDANFAAAAKALAEKLGWAGEWIGGGRADGRGNVFVCVDDRWDGTFTVKEKPEDMRAPF